MPILRQGSSTCMCPTCGRFFSTTANFDRHREGPYDDDSRRCLSPREMEAKGMFERGDVWRQLPPEKPFHHGVEVTDDHEETDG